MKNMLEVSDSVPLSLTNGAECTFVKCVSIPDHLPLTPWLLTPLTSKGVNRPINSSRRMKSKSHDRHKFDADVLRIFVFLAQLNLLLKTPSLNYLVPSATAANRSARQHKTQKA